VQSFTEELNHFQPNNSNITPEVVENNDVGEHEDSDVRTERQKVADILSNWNAKPPVVVVQVVCYCVVALGMVMTENM